MATLKKVPPTPPPPTYIIELSEEEANGLRTVLNMGVSKLTLQTLQLTELSNLLDRHGPVSSVVRLFSQIGQIVPR